MRLSQVCLIAFSVHIRNYSAVSVTGDLPRRNNGHRFYRTSVAVIAPDLIRDLGMDTRGLSLISALFLKWSAG